jgi:hypothetical protein
MPALFNGVDDHSVRFLQGQARVFGLAELRLIGSSIAR